MAARGKFKEKNWRRSSGDPATIDDITVIVIPILPYKNEICNPGVHDQDGQLEPESPDEEVELEVHFDEKNISKTSDITNNDLQTNEIVTE